MIVSDRQKFLLLGIGNEFRSDDGIGLIIVRQIQNKQISSITVKEATGEGTALMEAWKGYESVILVDAISSGTKPGTILKMEASKEIVPAKLFHYSTHAFGVAEAIELSREMKLMPPELFVYGIEGANFSAGITISQAVQESAHLVLEQILKKVKNISR
jgi:hydrogenase maturation protease